MHKTTKIILISIFLAGAILRMSDTFRPINQASWRENDLGAIARNYARESMNPLYPRIDWRGNTEGFAEMEFPLYPYLIAVTYRIFGVHDYFGRIWAFLFSLSTLFFFFKLAREYLCDFALVFACLFFTFNPLIIEFSTAIQPEGLMTLFYIASVYVFLKWLKTDENKYFWLAVLTTSLTLLAKITAAHIGLFFGVLFLQKFGVGVFKQIKVWLFGVFTLFPALIWYIHARNLWKIYGNSLGVSNEYHWIGWDFFTNSYFIKGILHTEFTEIWMVFGLTVGVFAVWRGFGEKLVNQSLLWLASIFVMYLIAARTTADEWAIYYHIFAAAPAALLFGFGVGKFWDYLASLTNFFGEYSMSQKLARIFVISTLLFFICAAFLREAEQVHAVISDERATDESFVCAADFKSKMPKKGLILASGGKCFDDDGYPVAYNASFMFYWLERKGFDICVQAQSVEKVKDFAAKGAKYFVAQKSFVNEKADFAAELKQNFPLVAGCDEFFVFDIEN